MDQLLRSAQATAESVGRSALYVVAALVIVWIAKVIFDLISRCDDDAQIVQSKNLAMGIRRAGLYLGLTIGMIGVVAGPTSESFWGDFQAFALDGGVLVAMMIVASLVANRLLLPQVNDDEEVEKGNLAVGWVELGTFVAVGMVAFASFVGEGGGLVTAAVFFGLGLLGLIAVFQVFRLKGIAKFDVVEEICAGNTSAGMYVGSRLIALGIILAASLLGPFTTWEEGITGFVLFFVFGAILLSIVSWLVDAAFLPKTRIRDAITTQRNTASIAVVAGLQIAAAVVVAAAI